MAPQSLADVLIAVVVLVLVFLVPFVFVWWRIAAGYDCPKCGSDQWNDFGHYRYCFRCGHYQLWNADAGRFLDDEPLPMIPDDELPFAACTEEDDPPGPLRFDPLADIPDDLPEPTEIPADDSD